MYSLKKIKMKRVLPYSVLNPETSSDSASTRSKGLVMVSTKIKNIQKPKKIKEKEIGELGKLKVWLQRTTPKNRIPKQASSLILREQDRRTLREGYLAPENHLTPNIEKEETPRSNSTRNTPSRVEEVP